jgi:hypothetical protein
MADRTWNGIDGRLFLEFGALDAVILAILIAGSPNEYGVYDLPLPFLRKFIAELKSDLEDKKPHEAVGCALDSLEAAGPIRRYSGKSFWITRKFSRSRFKHVPRNQHAALKYIASHHPSVLADFAQAYCNVTTLEAFETRNLAERRDIRGANVRTLRLPNCGDIKAANVATTDPDPDLVQSTKKISAETAEAPGCLEPKSKPTRGRPTIAARPLLQELKAKLPEECLSAWDAFEVMTANLNDSGKVSESRMAGLLMEILERTKGLPSAAINYGLLAAVTAKGGGAPNPIYVSKAAHGYDPELDFSGGGNGSPGQPSWVGKSRDDLTEAELEDIRRLREARE